MATNPRPLPYLAVTAKVTSKGQVTIPVEIRRNLGVRPGASIRFEQQPDGIRVLRETEENPFEKWRGIGGFPGMGSGREAIIAYFRELRGHDDLD
jgi:AbrB family looped-hinge helix DNA binding protein